MLKELSERVSENVDPKMERAAEAIRAGGTVVIGTETFYALAADPFRDDAVEKIFLLKRRPFLKPLPLIAAHPDLVISKAPNLSEYSVILIKSFWPGSLTILLNLSNGFSKHVRNDSGQIAVRVPPKCPARDLAVIAGGWITSTSVNLSGAPPHQTVSQIPEEIIAEVDVVVDTGPCPGGLPSTVIDISSYEPRILRTGAISTEEIMERLEKRTEA